MKSKFFVLLVMASILAPAFVLAAGQDDALISMEHALYDQVKNKDMKGFAANVTDNVVSIDPQKTTWDKAALVEYLTPIDMQQYSLTDSKVTWIDKDCAAVTSKFNGTATYNGQPMPPGDWTVTTIWVKKGGKWLATFHQETPVAPMEGMQQTQH